MFFIKILFIISLLLYCNKSFSSFYGCDNRSRLFDNDSTYYEFAKKYDATDIISNTINFGLESDVCDNKIRVFVYYFFYQRQLKKDIRWHSPVIYDDEKNEIIKLLNLITDNPKKSQQIFDIFYDDYLNRHYQEKQNCSNKCRFFNETLVDGLKITVVGEVYDIENIALRKKSHIIRLLIERVG